MHLELRGFEEIAAKTVAKYMLNAKSSYKDLTGTSLKLEQKSANSNVEMIELNQFNNTKKAYFRFETTFQILE